MLSMNFSKYKKPFEDGIIQGTFSVISGKSNPFGKAIIARSTGRKKEKVPRVIVTTHASNHS